MNDSLTKTDRMRYVKNKFSANITYLAILFDVFYFVSIYKSDVGTYYYNILIGISIVYNLCFMLFSFLASEGVKTYNEKHCYILLLLGIFQFVRIFIIPLRASTTVLKVSGTEMIVMGKAQFIRCLLFLIISGSCLLSAAIVGIKRSRTLKKYLATLGEEKRRD